VFTPLDPVVVKLAKAMYTGSYEAVAQPGRMSTSIVNYTDDLVYLMLFNPFSEYWRELMDICVYRGYVIIFANPQRTARLMRVLQIWRCISALSSARLRRQVQAVAASFCQQMHPVRVAAALQVMCSAFAVCFV
jgi:hypothetical protein